MKGFIIVIPGNFSKTPFLMPVCEFSLPEVLGSNLMAYDIPEAPYACYGAGIGDGTVFENFNAMRFLSEYCDNVDELEPLCGDAVVYNGDGTLLQTYEEASRLFYAVMESQKASFHTPECTQ